MEGLTNLEKVLKETEAGKPKLKKLWDNYKEIAEVQKNERLKFVIAAGTREGFRCLSIREFYFAKRDGVWKPGRDGILIPIVSPFKTTKNGVLDGPPKMLHPMQELLELLPGAVETATAMPLEDPENAMWINPDTKEIISGTVEG